MASPGTQPPEPPCVQLSFGVLWTACSSVSGQRVCCEADGLGLFPASVGGPFSNGSPGPLSGKRAGGFLGGQPEGRELGRILELRGCCGGKEQVTEGREGQQVCCLSPGA